MEEIYKNLSLENLEGEIWLPIEGYEGLYEVSNMGRIKSLKDNHNNPREKILSQCDNGKGYLKVMLCKEGKMQTFFVHRLVGNAFLENKNNLPCFNHKNEDKTDNRAVNLEPCTQKYNVNYKNAIQRRVASTDWKAKVAHTDYQAIGRKNAEKLINGVLSKKVYQYTKEKELVAIWESTQECGRQGYAQANVAACCRNCFNRKGNNVYKGYIWSYTEIN